VDSGKRRGGGCAANKTNHPKMEKNKQGKKKGNQGRRGERIIDKKKKKGLSQTRKKGKKREKKREKVQKMLGHEFSKKKETIHRGASQVREGIGKMSKKGLRIMRGNERSGKRGFRELGTKKRKTKLFAECSNQGWGGRDCPQKGKGNKLTGAIGKGKTDCERKK